MRGKSLAYTTLLALALAGCGDKAPSTASGGGDGKTPAGGDAAGVKEIKKTDVKVGTGKTIEAGDQVWMLYTGTFKNGEVFDSTDKHEGKPFAFVVGTGQVIPGWDKGVPGMKVGGERKLEIPWKDAYGERGSDIIPPKTDLYFDMKALAVLKKGDEDLIDVDEVKKGDGPQAAAGSTVTIDYVGTLPGGTEFESTKKLGKPLTFTIGKNEVMTGLEEGVKGMRVGGKRHVTVPPRYGKPEGSDVIPANSVLFFDIELKKVGASK